MNLSVFLAQERLFPRFTRDRQGSLAFLAAAQLARRRFHARTGSNMLAVQMLSRLDSLAAQAAFAKTYYFAAKTVRCIFVSGWLGVFLSST